jgi:hypothetical protein
LRDVTSDLKKKLTRYDPPSVSVTAWITKSVQQSLSLVSARDTYGPWHNAAARRKVKVK